MPVRNISKQASSVVGASLARFPVSQPFSLPQMGPAHIRVSLSAVSETTGIVFKLQDSFDQGSTYRDVGSESEAAVNVKTFTQGVREVTNVTWPAGSAIAHGDYLHATAQDGTLYAAWLNLAVSQVETVTCAAFAASAQGDYIVVSNQAGTKWAFWVDKDDNGTEPTGAAYLAVTALNRVRLDTTTGDDAAAVGVILAAAAAVVTGVTVTDNLDGTVEFAQNVVGVCTDIARHNTGDTGNGSFTLAVDKNGVAGGAVPTGALYLAADEQIEIAVNDTDTAAQVATKARAAIVANASWLEDFTTSSITTATFTITQVLGGAVADPAPKTENDGGAGSITVSVTTAGTNGASATNLSTNAITSSSHGFATGDRVIYHMGTLQSEPLVSGTSYYVIRVDANTLKLATTYENAVAVTPVPVDLTTYGVGTGSLYQADYEIRMLKEDSSDLAQMPFTSPLLVVVDTGASDSCTVSSVQLSE